jgi:hypothetical protein
MREIDKYTIKNIFLESNNGTFHIKLIFVVIKSNRFVVVFTHIKGLAYSNVNHVLIIQEVGFNLQVFVHTLLVTTYSFVVL